MKKLFLALALVFSATILSHASEVMLDNYVVFNGTGIVSDANYSLVLTNKNVDCLSLQINYSSSTLPSSISFTDGAVSTGTISITSNSGLTGSTITIVGGGYTTNLVNGIGWATGVVSSVTCTNIYNNLLSNTTGILFSKGATATVIYATAAVVNVNYTITPTVAGITSTGLTGGASTYFDYVNEKITQTNSFLTGLAVLYSTSSGTSPTGLTSGVTYYAIPTATYLQLATTKALAIAGTAIAFSSQTYPGGGNFTLTPLAISGSSNFTGKLQASDDGTYWSDLTPAVDISASSITITSSTGASSKLYDLGFVSYKNIRFTLSSGSFGAIWMKIIAFGKRVAN